MNDKNTELDEIEVETVETEEVTEAEEAPAKPESVEESIRKAYEQLSGKAEAEEKETAEPTEAAEKPEAEQVEAATEETETEAPAEEAEEVRPPERWTAKAKEWFRTQPKEAQREFARATADLEAQTTKVWQNLRRQEAKYKDIDGVIEHYAQDLHSKGVTHQQAIAEFFAANRALDQEPVAALARIMKAKGVTPDQIAEHLNGGGAKTSQQVNPEINQLRSTVQELNNWKQEQLQTVQQQKIQSIAGEFAAVRDEVDAQGKYKYPALHEPELTEALKPLVRGIRESQPNLSWGDALRKAYSVQFGTPSASSSAARLQAPQQKSNQINNTRARSVAVAGRSSGSSSASLDLNDVKAPKKTEDAIRLAMRLHGR
jgi:hypothetical protein